ncbi:hypothetical protein ACFQS3_15925 [Glycomyces mayteni]|uniref:Uncharacterized protein n=1 Tax=Glycomyces mayteni TaxID=543887 RepID=A0ABW2DC86_9ACTN|nr:hypothetical protein GCM10025732_17690 [Glycomyces mayteni]
MTAPTGTTGRAPHLARTPRAANPAARSAHTAAVRHPERPRRAMIPAARRADTAAYQHADRPRRVPNPAERDRAAHRGIARPADPRRPRCA